MRVTMFEFKEITDAVVRLCQGAVRLKDDYVGGDTIQVGSNCLFFAGDEVEISCGTEQKEIRRVLITQGLETIQLDGPLSGTYTVDAGAQIRLISDELPTLNQVVTGVPETLFELSAGRLPCVVIAPQKLEQSSQGGTNRSMLQEYELAITYLRARRGTEAEENAFLNEVGKLFNLLMSDPYLGGQCWHSWVRCAEHDRQLEQALRERGNAVRCMKLSLVCKVSALTGGS